MPLIAGSGRLFGRYLRTGLGLLAIYAVSGVVYLTVVLGGYRLVDGTVLLVGWTLITAVASAAMALWITVINLLYLLTQIVIAVDDVPVMTAIGRVARFVRSEPRELGGIFLIILVLVVMALAASVLTTAGLGLIGFVPLFWPIALPLQALAWLVRGLVFQYLRPDRARSVSHAVSDDANGSGPCSGRFPPAHSERMIDYDGYLSRAAVNLQESAIRKMGTMGARVPDLVSFAAGFPSPDLFPWDELREIAADLLSSRDGVVLQYGGTRGYRPLIESLAGLLSEREIRASGDEIVVTTGSQQGIDLLGRVLIDPGDVLLVELPAYAGAITAFRNLQARLVGVRQEHDGVDLAHLDEVLTRERQQRNRIAGLYLTPNFQNPTGLLLSRLKRQRLLEWAARREVLLIEDDPYGSISFDESRRSSDTRPIKADDEEGRVVYMSTFSKTLAPGLRVAWVAAPAPIAAKIETVKQATDLCTGVLDQRIVHEALRRGIVAARLPELCRGTSSGATRWSPGFVGSSAICSHGPRRVAGSFSGSPFPKAWTRIGCFHGHWRRESATLPAAPSLSRSPTRGWSVSPLPRQASTESRRASAGLESPFVVSGMLSPAARATVRGPSGTRDSESAEVFGSIRIGRRCARHSPGAAADQERRDGARRCELWRPHECLEATFARNHDDLPDGLFGGLHGAEGLASAAPAELHIEMRRRRQVGLDLERAHRQAGFHREGAELRGDPRHDQDVPQEHRSARRSHLQPALPPKAATIAIERAQHVVERNEIDVRLVHDRRAYHVGPGAPSPADFAGSRVETVEEVVFRADEDAIVQRQNIGGRAAEGAFPEGVACMNVQRRHAAVL